MDEPQTYSPEWAARFRRLDRAAIVVDDLIGRLGRTPTGSEVAHALDDDAMLQDVES